MTSDLTAGIVRILNSNGETSGTGFVLTGDSLITTCTHLNAGYIRVKANRYVGLSNQ